MNDTVNELAQNASATAKTSELMKNRSEQLLARVQELFSVTMDQQAKLNS